LREIGKLPKSADSQLLRDHLLSLGMSTHATDSPDGTTIWIHNEDHLPKAREEFQAYAANPDDPRFQSAAETASKVLKEKERLDREYHRNVRSFKGRWQSVNFRRRPLTSALAAICIGIFVTERLSPGFGYSVQDWLGFFPEDVAGRTNDLAIGLRAILQGQIWRLITPIFLHVSIMHIVFNVWALVQAGTLIETKRGTSILALLVFLAAVASNVGQYIYMITVDRMTIPFAGISGVVYALFGYIWMKGRVSPEEGMILHPNTVRIMLGWLVLGFVWRGIRMANGSHVVGLIVGMLFGLAGF
jgi:rhomboid protease GlpG